MKGRIRLGACAVAALVATLAPAAAAAQATQALIELINAYRSEPQTCEGRRMRAAGPLAPEPVLARVDIGSKANALDDALARAGYAAARSYAIVLSGPGTARSAMTMLESRYCRVLLDPRYADIGVSRQGDRWQLVFARPLLSPTLGEPREAGKEILKRVNEARAQPRTCGDERFRAAPPLQWDAKLAATALAHSRDMAQRSYLAHEGEGGRTVGERATRHGYEWREIGENIATGQGSPQEVLAAWLTSPHHCANIMHPGFTEMGAAYAVNRASEGVIYWTQVLGRPRR